eukprot:TRINITY_DN26546_c2_g1_i1.p1 TRINITY_DN26546_c2_g1~~TRINITY_DN26546_c2_g1_i1.p1  ORF type:complete len:631 (+),score=189.95 TRINITY_DN26546_c2_g1_i1:60-1952(+)
MAGFTSVLRAVALFGVSQILQAKLVDVAERLDVDIFDEPVDKDANTSDVNGSLLQDANASNESVLEESAKQAVNNTELPTADDDPMLGSFVVPGSPEAIADAGIAGAAPEHFAAQVKKDAVAKQQIAGAMDVLHSDVAKLKEVAEQARLLAQERAAKLRRQEEIFEHDQEALEHAKATDAVETIKQADLFFRLKEAKELNEAKKTIQELHDVSEKATQVAKSMKILAETQAFETNKQVTDAKQIIQQSWFVAVKAQEVSKAARMQAAAWVVQADAAAARAAAGNQSAVEAEELAADNARKISAGCDERSSTIEAMQKQAVKTEDEYEAAKAAYEAGMKAEFAGIKARKIPEAEQQMGDGFASPQIEALAPGVLNSPKALPHALEAARFDRWKATELSEANLDQTKRKLAAESAEKLGQKIADKERALKQQSDAMEAKMKTLDALTEDALRRKAEAQGASQVAENMALQATKLQQETKAEAQKAATEAVAKLAVKDVRSRDLPGNVGDDAKSVSVAARVAEKANRLDTLRKAQIAASDRTWQREASAAAQVDRLTMQKVEAVGKYDRDKANRLAELNALRDAQLEALRQEQLAAGDALVAASKAATAGRLEASQVETAKRIEDADVAAQNS